MNMNNQKGFANIILVVVIVVILVGVVGYLTLVKKSSIPTDQTQQVGATFKCPGPNEQIKNRHEKLFVLLDQLLSVGNADSELARCYIRNFPLQLDAQKRILVSITFNQFSQQNVNALKAMGLTMEFIDEKNKFVVSHVSIDTLKQLADLSYVSFIEPLREPVNVPARDLPNSTTVSVSLGRQFTLTKGQVAKIADTGVEVDINKFCLAGDQCVSLAADIEFDWRFNGQVQIGGLQAFGYQITVITTDNKTYANVVVEKMK